MAQAVLYSPYDVTLRFVGSNPAPQVRPYDALPGVANVYSGQDPQKWVTAIPRYSSVEFSEVYPGIDVRYVIDQDRLLMRLICRPGCDPRQVVVEASPVLSLTRNPDGTLFVRLVTSKYGPYGVYTPPAAYQEMGPGRASADVGYEVIGTNRFGFQVATFDASLPLHIEMNLQAFPVYGTGPGPSAADRSGNAYLLATVPDAAGKEPPFPSQPQAPLWAGCGINIGYAVACSDVAVYKFSAAGDLVYVTYVSGRTTEAAAGLHIGSDGTIAVAGATNSRDFPVTEAAYQRTYAGPEPKPLSSSSSDVEGDFFAARLNAATGALAASTYVGGPGWDRLAKSYLGADNSVYLVGKDSPGLPITPGALQGSPQCQEWCLAPYAIRLDGSLKRPIYSTYLPGIMIKTELHPDGSLYFTGWAGPGFPVTPNAYQKEPGGGDDGFVARLSPTGTSLLFGTYHGGPKTDWILVMAVAPDGSVWATVSSFVQCCVSVDHTLIHLDSTGSKLLYSAPFAASDLLVDNAGNVLSLSDERLSVSPDALLANACGPAFLKMSPNGSRLFATYLPPSYSFVGLSERGNAVIWSEEGRFELVLEASSGMFTGCAVSAANYNGTISPGEIATIFGSGMGPRDGMSFQLEDGRVPKAVAGTRVFLNGEPIPILYASHWQVNAIVPYSLPLDRISKVQVESEGRRGNEVAISYRQLAGTKLFTLDGSGRGQAAALNEDGTINSPRDPAKPGSVVMLFGTGGGETDPPSTAGEVTPLELRRLKANVDVWLSDKAKTKVEFAGAAPGLVAGVTQINIRLPDIIPEIPDYPRTAIPLLVLTNGYSHYPCATIAIK